MDLDTLSQDSGALACYNQTVRDAIDDHMSVLRSSSNNQILNIHPKDIERFRGDLYGLFSFLSIAPQYHYAVRRMNQLASPLIVPEDLAYLLVPDFKMIDRIRQVCTAS